MQQPAPAVTAADLAQQLAQSQQALAQLQASHDGLLRAVSHDLRAPLRHLTSFAPLLREAVEQLASAMPGEAADEAQEFLATMEQSARKMGRMLERLLQLAHAIKQPLALQAVDVGAMLQACAAPVQPLAEPVLLQADPVALRTVLTELLGNANKFSAGRPQPQVQVQLSMPAPQLWQIAIRDNGVGFDATRMDTAWPPFQRMHRDSDFDGVGCGLALAHRLAQRHGARLQLQAQPGEGCTAVLAWPAAI
ncbi:MAG: HAMP domain-containing histidine kinase [Acidovorax sp.]|jgi:signal transduction histidine kinase|nr:HAMP domain-containing histidine kinase [Acidovorax sp.]